MENEFDLIVIGAAGGYMAALCRGKGRAKGWPLIENGYVGGTCLNRGCIPTKTLLHCAPYLRCYRKKPGSWGFAWSSPPMTFIKYTPGRIWWSGS